jgi:hypothetical protein
VKSSCQGSDENEDWARRAFAEAEQLDPINSGRIFDTGEPIPAGSNAPEYK